VDHRAQHVVALDQSAPGGGDPLGVELGVVQLDIGVAGDTAIRVGVGPADQVRGLNVGQGEGIEACRLVVPQCVVLFGARDVPQNVFLVRSQLGASFGGEVALGCAEAQLPVLGP